MMNWLSARHILALSLSVILHFVILTSWSDTSIDRAKFDKAKPDPLFVQLNFNQTFDELPQQQRVVKKKDETPAKPKPKPKPKPKRELKPEKKEIIQSKVKPSKPKTSTDKQSSKIDKPAEQVIPEHSSPPKAQPKANLLERYMAELLKKIEKKKHYPRLARRKNLEGKVEVHFMLACDGTISELDINGNYGILRRATNKAIEAAHPFPEIPSEINCPLPINYAMAYTLDH